LLAARRLNQGRFTLPAEGADTMTLTRDQFDALVLGLPWQRVGDGGIITQL
jgi:transposase